MPLHILNIKRNEVFEFRSSWRSCMPKGSRETALLGDERVVACRVTSRLFEGSLTQKLQCSSFLVMTYFLLRGYSILPKKELHSCLRGQLRTCLYLPINRQLAPTVTNAAAELVHITSLWVLSTQIWSTYGSFLRNRNTVLGYMLHIWVLGPVG